MCRGVPAFGLTLTVFVAPPFSALDTLPSLGVVVLGLGVLMRDAVLAAIGAIGVATVLAPGSLVVSAAEHLIWRRSRLSLSLAVRLRGADSREQE